MATEHLLIELGTEELPPKALSKLSSVFSEQIVKGLAEQGVQIGEFKSFAAPRRLAILIKDVALQQADQNIERKGPHIKAAYDQEGNATKAATGFAQSCGTTLEQLTTTETNKGEYLFYKSVVKGADTITLLQAVIEASLKKLPIPKRMRWGDKTQEFVRPVHWLMVKMGKHVVPCNVLGINSNNFTKGHRFHSPDNIVVEDVTEYEAYLEKAFVVASFEKRKNTIETLTIEMAEKVSATAIIEADLLEEVTGLVEWPVPVMGEFEEKYLAVPPEVLIKTMQDNQKYFPLQDKQGKLTNKFITIANIQSKDEQQVKQGNERVVRPRLADAEFFWNTDRKQSLADFSESLKKVVFQKQLGTVFEKTQRIELLADQIAIEIGADQAKVKQAAALCKCDLMTSMVGEFASLQGVIGQYYAKHDGLDDEVADAIYEHYLPKQAGDILPKTKTGQAIALADKLDTLCGIFAIGQKPTGMKDPFALRRASLGVLRIIIECQLTLDLKPLIATSIASLPIEPVENAEKDILSYVNDRLKNYYAEQEVDARTVVSVLKLNPTRPLDFDKRVKAVKNFMQSDSAKSLAAANKRIGNLLKKQTVSCVDIDATLFTEKAEIQLNDQLQSIIKNNADNINNQDYQAILEQLSSLKENVDTFFEDVMVMVDDEAIKNNRLALLNALSSQFMQVADISGLG